jgi:hypothetical protein
MDLLFKNIKILKFGNDNINTNNNNPANKDRYLLCQNERFEKFCSSLVIDKRL